MASSSERCSGFDLEDFARSGAEAELARLSKQPGFALWREGLLAEGQEAGRREAAAQYAAEREALLAGPLSDLESLLAGLTAARTALLQENERELLALALAVAQRLVRAELRARPEAIGDKLRELLQHLQGESSVQVLVNPQELEATRALLESAARNPLGELPYRLLPDSRLPPGSVALEGDKTRLESIAADELQQLETALMETLNAGDIESAPELSAAPETGAGLAEVSDGP